MVDDPIVLSEQCVLLVLLVLFEQFELKKIKNRNKGVNWIWSAFKLNWILSELTTFHYWTIQSNSVVSFNLKVKLNNTQLINQIYLVCIAFLLVNRHYLFVAHLPSDKFMSGLSLLYFFFHPFAFYRLEFVKEYIAPVRNLTLVHFLNTKTMGARVLKSFFNYVQSQIKVKKYT